MPIFMDRHDLKGTTHADIAEAHRKDLEIQDKYGVRFLTYWFDQDRGTTFCLVDAPDKETAQTVHRQAHGFVAEEIVEVSLSAVEAFLGRITDPTPPAGRAESDMDAGHRTLLKVSVEQAALADEVMSVLMGEYVELRKHFIQTNAHDVRFLDI